ncbi:MAG: ankyrin repeat domain-containing protein, partial [Paludibacterium sp.]
MWRIAGAGALVLLLVIVFAYNNLWRRPLACQLAANGDTAQLARLDHAQLRQTDPLGNTALMFAAASDQKPAIALLLARGANPH